MPAIWYFHTSYLNRSFENLSDRLVKKIKLGYQVSLMETQKQIVPQNMKKGKKLLFNEEPKSQPSADDVNQKKILAASSGENLPDRDLTEEWCM